MAPRYTIWQRLTYMGQLMGHGGSTKVQVSVSKKTMTSSASSGLGMISMMQQTVEITVCPYGENAGRTKFHKSVKRDQFNNAVGPEYDLSPDNAFTGQRILVLQLYSDGDFSFAKPKASLERKGFAVDLYTRMPSVEVFTDALKRACQLWVISTHKAPSARHPAPCSVPWGPPGGPGATVTAAYMPAIQKLVDLKKGLFIWGDNDPYNADANFILAHLTQTHSLSLTGNYMGDTVLSEAEGERGWEMPGFYNGDNRNLVFTGIESIYEGETIASIKGPTKEYRSIMRASDGQVVTGVHDRDGVRIMIDGGFTRLFDSRWDRTAGTARFVTNAACWLYNFEGRKGAKKKYLVEVPTPTPTPTPTPGGRKGACFNCDNFGHLAKDCPLPRKGGGVCNDFLKGICERHQCRFSHDVPVKGKGKGR